MSEPWTESDLAILGVSPSPIIARWVETVRARDAEMRSVQAHYASRIHDLESSVSSLTVERQNVACALHRRTGELREVQAEYAKQIADLARENLELRAKLTAPK